MKNFAKLMALNPQYTAVIYFDDTENVYTLSVSDEGDLMHDIKKTTLEECFDEFNKA